MKHHNVYKHLYIFLRIKCPIISIMLRSLFFDMAMGGIYKIGKVKNHCGTTVLWVLMCLVRDNTDRLVFKSLIKYVLSIYYQTHGEK